MNAAVRTPPLGLCLAGPTAAGKTALALAFARELAPQQAVEIISVDSALVYRGMDIGTAKPSAAERAQVPHHLIDILEPTQAYSAARFVADATRLAAAIRARGALPLLVGGTMLYFKALREGLDAMPPADPALRQALEARAAREGWPALHAELARVDAASAARLAPHDAQRIQRALEVYASSGKPLSQWQRGARATDLTAWPLLALEPSSRAWLHARIDARFAAMLDAGLLDEVRALRARGDLHAQLPAMRCVGYRQVWQALETLEAQGTPGTQGTQGTMETLDARGAPQAQQGVDMAALAARGSAATRQLAKRQLTWLRGMTRVVVACDAPDALARGCAALRALAGV